MFNTNNLLGSLLQAGLRGSSMNRVDHAMGERGLGAPGGPLGQILSQFGGASRSGTAHGGGYPGGGYGQGGGGIGDILGGLAGMAGGHQGGGYQGGGGRSMGRDLAMGGLGALAASILSRRRYGSSMGGVGSTTGGGMLGGNMRGAVGAGGLALLGMLAMRALRGSGQPQGQGFANLQGGGTADGELEPPEQALSERTASLVLRAMIDAAKADGTIDPTERQKITAKVEENGADREEMAFLQQEMERPADPDGLAAEAGGDPVVAAQVYAASLLAIEVDTPAEQAYLRDLAARLRLDSNTVTQLHQALGAPAP